MRLISGTNNFQSSAIGIRDRYWYELPLDFNPYFRFFVWLIFTTENLISPTECCLFNFNAMQIWKWKHIFFHLVFYAICEYIKWVKQSTFNFSPINSELFELYVSGKCMIVFILLVDILTHVLWHKTLINFPHLCLFIT